MSAWPFLAARCSGVDWVLSWRALTVAMVMMSLLWLAKNKAATCKGGGMRGRREGEDVIKYKTI